MKTDELKKALTDLAGDAAAEIIVEDAPMAEYTSFRAGGKARLMVSPRDAEQLKDMLRVLSESGCRYMIFGNGSNILVKDSGYDGVMVRIGKGLDNIRREGENLICGSGALMSAVARAALEESLTGFEFASGIPGSIGGAVFMNAGAYGGELRDILAGARLISKDGKNERYVTGRELDMGYRHTILHETGDVVVEAELKLRKGDQKEIKEEMSQLMKRRNSKQPVNFPSAGSFFKRPEGYFAGKLIQDAGLKGLVVGGARVSELHSGFIINKGGARASDILQLAEIIQARVYDESGVRLEMEVRIIG